MQERTFKVLCVTKRAGFGGTTEPIQLHQDVTGEVVVPVTPDGIIPTKGAEAVFNGRRYPIKYIRTGLKGCAVVIAIENREGSPFQIWELYLSEPAIDGVTLDGLEELAVQSVARSR